MINDEGRGPELLFIDDDLAYAQGQAVILTEGGIPAVGLEPNSVSSDQVLAAQLALIDEFLEWQLPDGPATTRPADGLAVAAVLRSQNPDLCTAILTGNLERLAEGVPVAFGEHHIASLRDVEWVFPKGSSRTTERIRSLASAVLSVPAVFDADAVTSWLLLPDEEWAEAALEHITRCRPPLAPLQASSRKRVLLRWLLQRALPYPTFLLTDARAALALGVAAERLADFELGAALKRAEYSGPLSDFLGRRWWRAGIDRISDAPELAPELEAIRSTRPDPELEPIVLPLGSDLEELSPTSARDCVRIFPDGWPAFADQAWALRSEANPGSLQHEMLGLADRS